MPADGHSERVNNSGSAHPILEDSPQDEQVAGLLLSLFRFVGRAGITPVVVYTEQ
jgi:hypothetical protein